MRKLLPVLAAMVVMALVANSAEAQVFDHMKCFKIKDPASFQAQVLLDAYQINFNDPPTAIQGCLVTGRAKLFCVPVAKSVIKFTDRTQPPLTPVTMTGQNLKFDQLCYRVKCPVPAIKTQNVQDQFGARTIAGFVPALLCTPAIKIDDPPSSCINSSYPQCGGDCLTASDVCRPKNDGTLGCDCLPAEPPCDQSGPQCGGACPALTQTCVATAAGGCYCSDVDVLCEQTSAPQCGGYCPSNLVCNQSTDGKCRCAGTLCGPDPTGMCGGACANGTTCQQSPIAGNCSCH